MGGVWITGDVITAARMNQKTNLVDTGANINSATPYTGMIAYCTTSGSGFTSGLTYQYNGSSWGLFGVAPTLQVSDVYSSTIGDYTQPSSATSSSGATVTDTIAFDQGAGFANSSITTSKTYSVTVGSGTNRMLLVCVNFGDGTTPSSVTYNGTGMTLIASTTANSNSGLTHFYQLAAPSSGTNNLVVNVSGGPHNISLSYAAYTGVKQSSSFGTAQKNVWTSSPVSQAITTTVANSWVISCIGADTSGAATYTITSPNNARGAQSPQDSGFVSCGDQPAATTGTYTAGWTFTGGSLLAGGIIAVEMFVGTKTSPASNTVDGSTSTEWISTSETHPNVYVDMGAVAFLTGAAIYWDSSSTVTQLLVQTSPDATTWTTVRTINTNLFTNGAWNYFRWSLPNTALPRYVRFYGNDGTAKVLQIWEIKIKQYANTLGGLQSLFNVHGHPPISTSDGTLALSA